MEFKGDMSFETVSAMYAQRQKYFSHTSIDLADAGVIDSAGIAFLVKWSKSLKGSSLVLKHAPVNARNLIKTFNLSNLFILED